MKTIRSILGTLIIAFLSAACVLFVLPRAFGVQLYCILSGSMEPAYRLNDLIYTVPVECEELRTGDTISFAIAGTNAIVTHRVVENDTAQRHVFTKGDANAAADSAPVPYENVKGLVRFRIPGVGAILMMLSSKIGKIISITVGAAIILISMIFAVGANDQEQPQQSRRQRAGQRRAAQGKARSAASAAQRGISKSEPRDAAATKQPRQTHSSNERTPPHRVAQTGVQASAAKPTIKQRACTKADLPPSWR